MTRPPAASACPYSSALAHYSPLRLDNARALPFLSSGLDYSLLQFAAARKTHIMRC
jgi:hypothetical protein